MGYELRDVQVDPELMVETERGLLAAPSL